MDRAEDDRHAEDERQQRQPGDRHMHGEDESHRLAQVVIDAPPKPDGRDDRVEIVVEEDDGRSFARDVRAASAHGNADMGRFQRRRVVDAVPGHRNDLVVGLSA